MISQLTELFSLERKKRHWDIFKRTILWDLFLNVLIFLCEEKKYRLSSPKRYELEIRLKKKTVAITISVENIFFYEISGAKKNTENCDNF
jgi:hypothetical protein